ncbi:hypothetical protein ABT246_25785 [Streptomyces sp. NPDC001553]|uniref:hypothetical protein n=1 Tax=Streptomyces sp. NPDC001553 TaxID=3154385 RepID=UPI00332C583C
MTTVVSRNSTVLDRAALIACGVRTGKTTSCAACAAKAEGFLRIADTGALDGLAAAICRSRVGGACQECTTKATEILRLVGVVR